MEALLHWVPAIGYTGLGVLVVGWLVVSFSPPGPRRAVVEWLAACGMYVALLSLFVNLLGRALEADKICSTPLRVCGRKSKATPGSGTRSWISVRFPRKISLLNRSECWQHGVWSPCLESSW